MALSDRLRALLERDGITRQDLADKIGASRQAVQFWASGRNAPRGETLKRVAEFFNVSTEWLRHGVGDPPPGLVISPPRVREITGDKPPVGAVAVPVYNLVFSAGHGCEPTPEWEIDENSSEMWFSSELFQKLRVNPERCRVAIVHGDSMVPSLLDGARILFEENFDFSIGANSIVDGKIYVISIDEELKIKRLAKTKRGIRVISDNQEMFPPEEYVGEECNRIRVYGRVYQAINNFY